MAIKMAPVKTPGPYEDTMNRLRALPLPTDARPSSTLKFGIIVPPSPFVVPRGWEWAHTAPFEGPSMIAGLLKGLGYNVKLLDQRETYDPEDLRDKVGEFDLIGFSTFGDSFNYLKRACEVIKEARPELKIVFGGPLVTSAPKLIMENTLADYGVLGEGELTLTEFMDWYTKNKFAKPIERIPGLIYKGEDGVVRQNIAREQIRDLDALPFQDFTVWDRFKADGVIPEIYLSYSRGCIANCTFCYRAFPKLNAKSPERVRKEILYYSQFGFRFAWWSDLTFVTDQDYVRELMKTAWSAYDFRSVIFSRVVGVDTPILSHMQGLGLDLVLYGMESVSKATLNNYHKGITKNAIVDAIYATRNAQVKIGGLFIIGGPTDNAESMQELVDFCTEFKEVTRVKYLSAITGTQDYRKFVKEGVIPDEVTHLDWLSRERSIEEDIWQPGFVKFAPNLTKDEMVDVYRRVNGVIEARPYDYMNPINTFLDKPDAKFYKRPIYLENSKQSGGHKIMTSDAHIRELREAERRNIQAAKARAATRARKA